MRGEWAFEVTEDVGHEIVQPSVYVHQWVCRYVDSFVRVGCPSETLSDVT